MLEENSRGPLVCLEGAGDLWGPNMLHIEDVTILCGDLEALLVEALVESQLIEAVPGIVVCIWVVLLNVLEALQLIAGLLGLLFVVNEVLGQVNSWNVL